jgi:Ca-activated chloride channel homolog
VTRRLTGVLLAIAATTPQLTFRAATELVRIDTLVVHDGAPVVGLEAKDFQVLDNGTPQHIVALSQMDAITVCVALDTSGSMKGERFDLASRATLALLGQLRNDDSSVVVGFSNQVSRVIPANASVTDRQRRLGAASPAGSTGLGDGIYAAAIACDTGPGPKLLILLSDGRNNASWLSGHQAIDTARRHEVVIYTVGAETDGGTSLQERRQATVPVRHGAARLDLAEPVPDGPDEGLKLLEVVAKDTGGRAFKADWSDRLSATFRAILDEYRQRYIIAFAPDGVSKGDGWHTLQVKLRKGAKGDVHARAGYWSPATAGAPAASK